MADRQGGLGEVISILRESPPPFDRLPPALAANAPRIAFKTGTSYGFRDALAAGVGDGWTVVVWTGRADGKGEAGPDLAAIAALPLLFQVFDVLEGDASPPPALAPHAAPSALKRIDVADLGPQILFPPDGSTVLAGPLWSGGAGLRALGAGRGGALVCGRRAPGGRAGWRPADLAAGRARVLCAGGGGWAGATGEGVGEGEGRVMGPLAPIAGLRAEALG